VKEGRLDCFRHWDSWLGFNGTFFRHWEVNKALEGMKQHKAPGLSRVVTGMLQAAGEVAAEWLT